MAVVEVVGAVCHWQSFVRTISRLDIIRASCSTSCVCVCVCVCNKKNEQNDMIIINRWFQTCLYFKRSSATFCAFIFLNKTGCLSLLSLRCFFIFYYDINSVVPLSASLRLTTNDVCS